MLNYLGLLLFPVWLDHFGELPLCSLGMLSTSKLVFPRPQWSTIPSKPSLMPPVQKPNGNHMPGASCELGKWETGSRLLLGLFVFCFYKHLCSKKDGKFFSSSKGTEMTWKTTCLPVDWDHLFGSIFCFQQPFLIKLGSLRLRIWFLEMK